MELPIDHFRLLGVSPSVETEAVLRALQVRLDHFPEDGFTREALTQRANLLRLSADLLTDQTRREEYESALLAGAVGLEISSNKEIGGLILLWEAKAPFEAFQLACKSLQPPQAPALGSGREADLTLLAALSCRAASWQEQEDRHYESAADLLREGMKLLQRMGKLPEQRKLFEEDLKDLLPYRILDLLSRDLSDEKSRQLGLSLLDEFVLKRGGLEGRTPTSEETVLEQSEFELFFQQIRNFLTVQEQVDLFVRWQKKGSSDAGFLAVLALAASGFSCRKPERIFEARKYLEGLRLEGVDPLPLLGSLDLLLADIDLAKKSFLNSPDPRLQDWLNNYPADSLAAICDYTRDWLKRDALPGYRDVNSQEVDLEAWFADRDIQEYVDRLERKGVRERTFKFFTNVASDVFPSDSQDDSLDNVMVPKPESLPTESVEELTSKLSLRKLIGLERGLDFLRGSVKSLLRIFIKIRPSKKALKLIFFILILSGASYISLSLVSQRYRLSSFVSKQFTNPKTTNEIEKSTENSIQKKASENIVKEPIKVKLLTTGKPKKEELFILIDTWLKGKAQVLSGNKDSSFLANVARPDLLKRVKEERQKDKSQGKRQEIISEISNLKVIKRSPQRIELDAEIKYSDKRINSKGETVAESSFPKLKVKYILGRDPDGWRLQAYISGV